MSNIKISMNGLGALDRALWERASSSDINKVVRRNTTQMQQQAMANASSVYTKGYSNGDTKKSIGIRFEDRGMSGVTGLGMEYNQYTELGTRFMAAEPLLKPVFNKQKTVFKSDLEKLLK